jgi:tight adherence protein C
MSAQYSLPILFSLAAAVIYLQSEFHFAHFEKFAAKIGDQSGVADRLAQLGKGDHDSYLNFRIFQVVSACVVSAPLAALMFIGSLAIAQWLALELIAIVMTVLLTERHLTNRIARRRRAVEIEFPAIVEMLTLAIGAGESPPSAIKRISMRAKGYLADEFNQVIKDLEDGKSFQSALDQLSRRVNSSNIRRFVDSLIISISRGTPLVETLTHASMEARNSERVKLLEAAGKSEVSMMIPVVFLILPISILFALFPSLSALQSFS